MDAAYDFPNHAEFLDREQELERLTRWWEDERDPFPLVLFGRRRTGKSWLLREFAHRKDADFLVCDTRAERDQLSWFAGALASSLGFRPELSSARSLFELLLRPDGRARRLVVIDEFPLLLSVSRGADSTLAAAMEERGAGGGARLVLCGSQVATMESLLAERAPLHGRATPMLLAPLRFDQARGFIEVAGEDIVSRYAIAGGMPLYLRRLGRRGSLRRIVCDEILSPLGPLFNEAREVLSMELTSTATHFSLLAALAGSRSLEWPELLQRSRVEESIASRYIRILEELHLVASANPVLAPLGARRRRYRVADPFLRFWFRFVFPFQADLTAGLRPEDHYDRNVAPHLADHAAWAFEDICRDWVRAHFGHTTDTVGSWWGLARHDLRRARSRLSEEVDIVGTRGDVVTVIGECRWQRRPMGRDVLTDLTEYKLPALAQTGADTRSAPIVLFSRGGFSPALVAEATRSRNVELVGLKQVLEAS
jgi:AAA+ ATPase superfamily predicted ATPase